MSVSLIANHQTTVSKIVMAGSTATTTTNTTTAETGTVISSSSSTTIASSATTTMGNQRDIEGKLSTSSSLHPGNKTKDNAKIRETERTMQNVQSQNNSLTAANSITPSLDSNIGTLMDLSA